MPHVNQHLKDVYDVNSFNAKLIPKTLTKTTAKTIPSRSSAPPWNRPGHQTPNDSPASNQRQQQKRPIAGDESRRSAISAAVVIVCPSQSAVKMTNNTTNTTTTTSSNSKSPPCRVSCLRFQHRKMSLLWLLLMICAFAGDSGGGRGVSGEHVRELEVSEGVPIGHQIGFIGEFLHGVDSGPPYLIVPVPGSAVDTDLAIDHTTGEIRTKVLLDREKRALYSLVAIPLSGENVRVVIRVLDENDNAPSFPTALMNIEFPENTPRDVKRTLNPARDLDLSRYNTQRYNIVSGNVNNAFRLSSHRERDGVLYLDLQINGFLDRETTPAYSLVVEALDGGNPPLRGLMTVNITIQDVNDNQPIFNQSRYFATVPENATIGTTVLQVYATDQDAGDNGLVEYAINRRQSDKD
ncbi:protein dachsous-like, partial [Uranotaenia lowii]|uniref:protein dachsous-like n=1 Tax=Uranotaenia lowii TaxID=190385 RepID=UPI00247AE55F